MTDALRVIVDVEPASGAWNMAVDEVLLETALATGLATLRWYRWSEPTLSLGHFQRTDELASEARFTGLPRVRRLTGGGAILHDQEWTYSLALGPEHPRASPPGQLYRVIHEAVITVLHEHGLPARLRGAAEESLNHHFLCFSRGDANDVVIGSHKVLGSAQRRRRGAVLQHGALLLHASKHAPEFPGLVELASGPVDLSHLKVDLTTRMSNEIDTDWQAGDLNAQEQQRVSEVMTRSRR